MNASVGEVISTRDMRILETNAEYFGLSNLQLMENAGRSIANEVVVRFPNRKTCVAIFCGLGGNGGDGFAAARHLVSLGYRVNVIVAGKSTEIKHDDALKNWLVLKHLLDSNSIYQVRDSSQIPDLKADVVVDALLGIGSKGALRQPILDLIKMMNRMETWHLAVDIPTGLDSDSGEISDQAFKADLTVTFYKAKPGLLKADDYVGELSVKNIGLPKILETYAGPGDVKSVAIDRPTKSHKGDFGKLLVVGGSQTFSGAPALVALAALRTGVDLTYIMAPEKTAYSISAMDPNLITFKLSGAHLNSNNVSKVKEFLKKVNAIVVGPGLGVHEETKEAVEEIIDIAEESGIPVVLDADGLKAFADFKRPLRVSSVLTPHKGEYLTLTGKELPIDSKESVEKVKKTAQKLNTVILLKGETDIISDGKRVKLNFTGNPGMTVGGTGDILSGIVGAFIAQGASSFEAATAAAFVNGVAGDFVKNEKGYHMLATDLLEWIPKIIDDPMCAKKVKKCGA